MMKNFHRRHVQKKLLGILLVLIIGISSFAPYGVEAGRCNLQFTILPTTTGFAPEDTVTYTYSIKNVGSASCFAASMNIYYAENETFVGSSLPPTAPNYFWYFGTLGKGKSRSVSVTTRALPGSQEIVHHACGSAKGMPDACATATVSVAAQASAPKVQPEGVQVQAWIYPGNPGCAASTEYRDGRSIDTLKPQYFELESVTGAVRLQTTSTDGCNAYSASNVADVKAHSKQQYVTVSSGYEGMHKLLSSASLQEAAISKLTEFAVSSGFTGVELDWEGFSDWTETDYARYKAFVVSLQDRLHAKGKKLMIDAPAIPNSTYQGYYLFKYEDFVHVDQLVIMAYDYQYDYGVGEPVAPEAWVADTVRWAKARVPLEKIVIGVASYGYHGTLGSYRVSIDTYAQSSSYPGFSTRTLNADGEEMWTSNGTYYAAQTSSTLANKKKLIESLGIQSISVWHLGGNKWF